MLGTIERAALVTEQDAVERPVRREVGRRAAIERHERPFAAPAHLVQRARGDFLAGARFAGDQHGGLGGRVVFDQVIHVLDRAASAEHGPEAAELAQGRAQRLNFLGQLVRPRNPREQTAQTRNVDRLEQVIPDAVAQAFNRAFDGGVAGHHDDGQCAAGRLRRQILEQIESAAVRQVQIDQHDVGDEARQRRARFGERRRGVDRKAVGGEDRRQA